MRKKAIITIVMAFFIASLYAQKDIINYAMPSITAKDSILYHKGFTISYNGKHKNANWVAYRLVGLDMQRSIGRNSNFTKDPSYANTATNADYLKSGYDKGHLFPAGSAWTKTIMAESFYLTNISPQVPNLNRGKWKAIEETVRKWAIKYDTVYVVTGSILASQKKIGNSVTVPTHFYKLVLINTAKRQQAIVFYIANTKDNAKPLHEYAITIDALEEITGIDFCTPLDNKIEKKVEQTLKTEDWEWNGK
jgi:endonuclease G